jgi:hypothetical protein
MSRTVVLEIGADGCSPYTKQPPVTGPMFLHERSLLKILSIPLRKPTKGFGLKIILN